MTGPIAYKCTLETNDLGAEIARNGTGEIQTANYGHDGFPAVMFKPGEPYDCAARIGPDGNVETPPAQ